MRTLQGSPAVGSGTSRVDGSSGIHPLPACLLRPACCGLCRHSAPLLPLPLPLPPTTLCCCSKTRHRLWFENPAVSRPIREDSSGSAAAAGGDQRLFPRECREAVSEPLAAAGCNLLAVCLLVCPNAHLPAALLPAAWGLAMRLCCMHHALWSIA